ncbi:Tol-Pal system beta propeller repeat protein TolB [Kiloniella laminariae]|uniref:Tol-Pal system protein TolB n=1 Tax=Kiloniella laminariae TaxID=454162 RepID=A0ABT4LI73_9PROT|nr:Tol-Pal system beta propeller repeat protein TolB [Kiloniella laminariae]MCZ4280809.1 Tol-Pal system beta propeller repeat protein TolB [Kiloniella laminariae]
MNIRNLVLAAGATLGMIVASVPAQAEINVNISQGFVQPLPVAVSDFQGGQPEDQLIGRDIAGVISANLERTGLFRPIDSKAFIQDANSLRVGVRFGDWRLINAQALVTGTTQVLGDGKVQVEFRLWDVYAENMMTGYRYTTTRTNWRKVAHQISDAIYTRLTGESGYFTTRIVYVSETGPQNRRQRRLAIMDQDGFNHIFLTSGRFDVFTPRFSPTSQEVTYLSFEGNVPKVMLLDIQSGREEVLGNFKGMSFAPRFAPDGNSVIMSLADKGNTEIYTMDLRTRKFTRLTNHPAIDTSPSYSPDGRKVVFNSDRGGSQQLYVMDANGGNVNRISFNKGRYATPVWSPRGDLIAFTRISGGKFFIGVMKADGSGERMLAEGYHLEGPTWSPNGRVISYFKQGKSDSRGQVKSKLYTIDLSGYNEREVVTVLDGVDPAWSPLLQ